MRTHDRSHAIICKKWRWLNFFEYDAFEHIRNHNHKTLQAKFFGRSRRWSSLREAAHDAATNGSKCLFESVGIFDREHTAKKSNPRGLGSSISDRCIAARSGKAKHSVWRKPRTFQMLSATKNFDVSRIS